MRLTGSGPLGSDGFGGQVHVRGGRLHVRVAHEILEERGGSEGELALVGIRRPGVPLAERIADAMGKGVAVVACENTMKGQKLTRADMLPAIGYVPAGVVELMSPQKEGFAYVRP